MPLTSIILPALLDAYASGDPARAEAIVDLAHDASIPAASEPLGEGDAVEQAHKRLQALMWRAIGIQAKPLTESAIAVSTGDFAGQQAIQVSGRVKRSHLDEADGDSESYESLDAQNHVNEAAFFLNAVLHESHQFTAHEFVHHLDGLKPEDVERLLLLVGISEDECEEAREEAHDTTLVVEIGSGSSLLAEGQGVDRRGRSYCWNNKGRTSCNNTGTSSKTPGKKKLDRFELNFTHNGRTYQAVASAEGWVSSSSKLTSWLNRRFPTGKHPEKAYLAAKERLSNRSQSDAQTVMEAAQKRQKGEVWKGDSGRWFTINDKGRAVPTKAPGGQQTPVQRTPKASPGPNAQPAQQKQVPKQTKPAAAKPGKMTVEQAQAHIEQLSKSGKTGTEFANELISTLKGMTVADIKTLRAARGQTKGTGKKEDLLRQLADKALEAVRSEKPKEQEKPKLPEAPKLPEKSKVSVQSEVKRLTDAIESAPDLTTEQRQEYTRNASTVVSRMTLSALERFASAITAPPKFVKNSAAVGATLAEMFQGNQQLAALLRSQREIGGAYTKHGGKSTFVLDGGYSEEAQARRGKNDAKTGLQVYAHEFAHAIDGPNHEYSDSAEWQDAWKEELSRKQLNNYSATKASEGFAEFGRLILAGEHNLQRIKQVLPKCYTFWEKRNLIPTEGKVNEAKIDEAVDGESVLLPDVFSMRVELDNDSHADVLA